MRAIKFRYWGSEIKQFVYSDDFDLETALFRLGAFFERASKYAYDRIIQQFTGAADKNGREIYEGDIVSWYDSAPWDEVASINVKGEVVFQGGQWWVNNHHYGDNLYNIEEVTVIGNAIENPGLLK